MTERVAIVAAAQTKFESCKSRQNFDEMVYEPVAQVLRETGVDYGEGPKSIGGIVCCQGDHWDGKTISAIATADVLGEHYYPEEKVAGDGALAIYYAMIQLLSGHYDIVLVEAHTKESHPVEPALVENMAMDPAYQRPLGLDFLSAAALQATRYMHKYAISPDNCALVAVKNRGNAQKNPFAHAASEITVADVRRSLMLASPIRALEAKPVSDGACVLLMAREEAARRLTDKPVWILGAGCRYDVYDPGDRELADPDSLVGAARHAYEMAGIADVRREVDLVELSENYAYQELLWSEGLLLCGRGEGGRLLESGATAIGGDIPVNASGGLLGGVPVNVAGANRVIEAFWQLRGEAGARQIDGARRVVAHGVQGVCGQTHTVLVLGRD